MGGPNMKMMRQLQQMQQKLAETQAELETAEVTASAGGGVVTVVVTGAQRVRSVTLSPEVVDPGELDLLQDLLLAAVNEGLDRSRQLAAERMGQVAGGLGLPPGLI
ncbi:MAG: YbaB/EbfC family nucleoid-associated protein [Candidatus Dormibacteria bacterium]